MELLSLASLPSRLLREVTAFAAAFQRYAVEVLCVRLIVVDEKRVRGRWQLPLHTVPFLGQSMSLDQSQLQPVVVANSRISIQKR